MKTCVCFRPLQLSCTASLPLVLPVPPQPQRSRRTIGCVPTRAPTGRTRACTRVAEPAGLGKESNVALGNVLCYVLCCTRVCFRRWAGSSPSTCWRSRAWCSTARASGALLSLLRCRFSENLPCGRGTATRLRRLALVLRVCAGRGRDYRNPEVTAIPRSTRICMARTVAATLMQAGNPR